MRWRDLNETVGLRGSIISGVHGQAIIREQEYDWHALRCDDPHGDNSSNQVDWIHLQAIVVNDLSDETDIPVLFRVIG